MIKHLFGRRNLHVKKFQELIAQLERNTGQTMGTHVMSVNAQSSPAACPFLTEHPLLKRTALNESNARSYNRRFPLNIVRGQGALVYDEDGTEYIDCLAGIGSLNVGHNHPVVVDAVRGFLDAGHPMQLLDLSSPVKDRFVSLLLDEVLPPAFARDHAVKLQFCSPCGTDATEAAVKLAKIVTGRSTVLAFSGAYHGHTSGAMSWMGNVYAKQLMPALPGPTQFLPYPYAHRCPFGIGADGHHAIADYIERLLHDDESGLAPPAAMLIECVQGEGGIVPAEAAFLQRMRRLTEQLGIVLIVDEVQTGFGRTGTMFAHEQAGIVPDILCMAKSVGGGLPLALIAYRGALDQWPPGAHAGTFRGNQLAMATGHAALRWTLDHQLPAAAARKGDWLMDRLRQLQASHPHAIADVRGRGLMIGIELTTPERAAAAQLTALIHGLIVVTGGRQRATLRLLAPLIIEDHQLEKLFNILKIAITTGE